MTDIILKELKALSDESYRSFQGKLMPTINRANILGVRSPLLRAYAKELYGTEEAENFLQELPHRYYEENNLHAFLVERIKDFDRCIAELNRFLPYVDNWATCDSMNPKVLTRYKEELLPHIDRWLASEQLYTRRYAIGLLMGLYLDADFRPAYLAQVAACDCSEYYIHMMVAWYFATALAKQYDYAFPYIEQGLLDTKTHNKAIQKAIESNRIPPERKQFLRSYKRK